MRLEGAFPVATGADRLDFAVGLALDELMEVFKGGSPFFK